MWWVPLLIMLCTTPLQAQLTLNYADLNQSNSLKTAWHITADTVLEGHARRLTLAAPITIDNGVTLTLNNCVLQQVSSHNLIMGGPQSRLVLCNSALLLAQDIEWQQGQLEVRGMSQLRGTGHTVWHHTSRQPTIISKNSTLLCADCSYSYDPDADLPEGLIFDNRAATLMLHNAHLHAGCYGWQMIRGTLCIHEQCTVSASSKQEKRGIILGSGRRKDNMRFILATPQSRLSIIQPHFCEKQFSLKKWWHIAGWCGLALAGAGMGIATLPKNL